MLVLENRKGLLIDIDDQFMYIVYMCTCIHILHTVNLFEITYLKIHNLVFFPRKKNIF